MRILISALSRFTQPTGICRYAANLARCLSDLPQIADIKLVLGQWQVGYFQTVFDITSNKIELVPIAIANDTLARNRWFAFGLPQVANSLNSAIVHLGFPLPILRARFKCPVVVTVHDLYPFELPESFARLEGLGRRILIKQCIRGSDAVACVSEGTLAAVEKRFPRLSSKVPLALVHNYVDFSPRSEAPSAACDPRPFLLTVAQHRPNKRLDLLLKAFARLRSEGRVSSELKLLVVGSEGPESAALRALSRSLMIDSCVQWVSQLTDPQLAWMYQNSKAYIASSSIEGFCIPLLEALLFNCRVVASNIPVFHEIGGEAPTYFDLVGDPVANLTSAILRSIETPKGTSEAPLRFSRKNTAEECLVLYTRLSRAFSSLGGLATQPDSYRASSTSTHV